MSRRQATGVWIPACAGMTGWRGNDGWGTDRQRETVGLDSRLRGNDGGGAGMTDGGRTSRGEDGWVGFPPARE